MGFLLVHVRSRDGVQDQENTPMSPDPFPRERLGSGNETKSILAYFNSVPLFNTFPLHPVHGPIATSCREREKEREREREREICHHLGTRDIQ